MKLFELHRDVDTSGVSGTGVVAQGAVFDNGMVVVAWVGARPVSVGVYQDLKAAMDVHGHGGHTRFVQVFDHDAEKITHLITNRYQDDCEGITHSEHNELHAKYFNGERDKALALMTPKPLVAP